MPVFKEVVIQGIGKSDPGFLTVSPISTLDRTIEIVLDVPDATAIGIFNADDLIAAINVALAEYGEQIEVSRAGSTEGMWADHDENEDVPF